MGNENLCIICLQDFENTIIKLDCNHCFHRKCINKWRKINDNCPICRKSITNIIEIKKSKNSKLIFYISFIIILIYSIIIIIFKSNFKKPFTELQCK